MVGILQEGTERSIGGAHLLHQVAKGPADSVMTALAYTGIQLDKVGHQLWDGHKALHDAVGIAGFPQVVQPHKALQSDAVGVRPSMGSAATFQLACRDALMCSLTGMSQTSAELWLLMLSTWDKISTGIFPLQQPVF